MNPFISQAAKHKESSAGYQESSTGYQESSTEQERSSIEEALTKTLEQEQLCLEQVIQLLKTEHKAIVERDIESMGYLLDKKLPLLSKLEQLDKQRQHHFEQQTGLSYHDTAFSRFIEHQASQATQTIWHTVKEKLPECKTQNELNGRIININKNNTEQILQILLGRPANSSQTYSHLGQTNMHKRSALYTSA